MTRQWPMIRKAPRKASKEAPETVQATEGEGQAAAQADAESQQDPATVTVFGRSISRANLLRAVFLVLFLVVIIAATVALWPVISAIFSESDRDNLVSSIQGAGPLGVLILLGLEFIQVVVAFIPGEVVQLVAGALYGPWWGGVIILFGCVLSTWFIYELVHRLGQPFVEEMVSTDHLQKFRDFEKSGKLSSLVFILFLIPGLPKDTFTYLVPLTSMQLREYLLLTTVARAPGVFMSTFAAAGFVNGNIWISVVMLGCVGILALVAIFKRDKIFEWLRNHGK